MLWADSRGDGFYFCVPRSTGEVSPDEVDDDLKAITGAITTRGEVGCVQSSESHGH